MVGCTCAVKECLSSAYTNKKLRFHQFPRTQERCDVWINKCGRLDFVGKSFTQLRYMYVCHLHFEPRMYARKNLKKSSFPTLLLPASTSEQTQAKSNMGILQNQTRMPIICNTTAITQNSEISSEHVVNGALYCSPKIENMDAYEDCPYEAQETNITNTEETIDKTVKIEEESQTVAKLTDQCPKKRQLKPTSHSLQKRLKMTRKPKEDDVTELQFIKGCDTFLTPKLRTIVKMQIGLKRHCENNRHSKEFKLFCLNIFYTSPLSYRFLSKAINLPSKLTLAKLYIPTYTKVSKQMWDLLTSTVKHMSAADKECVLCLDAMNLKCHLSYNSKADKISGLHEIDGEQRPFAARYAFTLMLQGIILNWKQPIGFSFIYTNKIDDQLRAWIIDTVKKLLALGFNIRAVVSDHRSDFINFSKSLGVDKNNSSFYIEGNKMFYIFDVPRLVKCVRNNLITCDYELDGKTATWRDIENLYNIDKTKDTRSVPRLSDCHVSPNYFQKQNLRFAVQVFSNSVAAALENCVASDAEISDGTIEFISIMNDLFDLLNSSNVNSPKLFNKPFEGNDTQIELLEKAQNIFSHLKITNKTTGLDVTSMKKFVNAFYITINSFQQLIMDMQSDNYRYLLTRWLNNECLENLFRIIRKSTKKCPKPTCIQFTRAFRKSFLCHLLKLSGETNRTEDFDSILAQFREFSEKRFLSQDSEINIPQSKSAKAEPTIQPTKYDIPEENAFQHICDYLFRKCIEKHKCTATINYASPYTGEHDPNSLYMRLRTYITDDQSSAKQGVPEDFVNYCHDLERELKYFQELTGNNIGLKLYQHLIKVDFNTKPCACFPVDFLVKLFVRMRIHYIITFNNRNVKRVGSKTSKYNILSVTHYNL